MASHVQPSPTPFRAHPVKMCQWNSPVGSQYLSLSICQLLNTLGGGPNIIPILKMSKLWVSLPRMAQKWISIRTWVCLTLSQTLDHYAMCLYKYWAHTPWEWSLWSHCAKPQLQRYSCFLVEWNQLSDEGPPWLQFSAKPPAFFCFPPT